MAGQGPTVKLTFAGDSANLDRAMQSVGSNADDLSKKVGDASERVRNSGDRLEEYADKADTADTRMMGFRDTITGLQDTVKGFTDDSLPLQDRLLTLGMGFGDLFSGLSNFLIPALGGLGRMILTNVIPAVWGFTSALLANPITWVVLAIAGLIAIIVLMITHWDWVKNVVSSVVGWIVDRWNWARDVLGGVARWIGDMFSRIWDGLTSGAKWALNFVIDILNGAIWALNGLVRGINLIPGVNIPLIPNIPKLHTGGVVPGVAGSEMLAVLQAGERVIPATGPQSGTGATVTFRGNTDSAFATAFMNLVRSGEIELAV